MRSPLGCPDNLSLSVGTSMSVRGFLLTAVVPLSLAWAPEATRPRRIALVAIALNDVSNQPVSPELPARMQLLTTALRERLTTDCGYHVASVDSGAATAAGGGPGYLYAHPDIAVGLAGAEAEWVIIPRLNRATPWVTDLQAHVVRVRDTALVSNRIVEVEGIELSPELATKLIERGAAWMADQLSQAIEHSSGAVSPAQRRCPA
jgi:hypothetical protein